jgi:hypothetical protein
MKTKSLIVSFVSAVTVLGAASVAYGQSAKSQSGGLPELAAEVAALRAAVQELQEQVSGGDPYTGTYAVTLVETALFGCRIANAPPPAPNYFPPYFAPLTASSVSVRSASFDAEADGSVLSIPDFDMLTQELKLNGFYMADAYIEDGADLTIGGDGSFSADLDDAQLNGQFSDDGSLFTALVVGNAPVTGGCKDVWTVNVTGVRK